mmetsp:Transcript_5659/g.11310  ORF Transcript_5659/g.11310 Transcript_5659/m.11310 type:complete len:95 (+) Transcript_5659:484-768(+)
MDKLITVFWVWFLIADPPLLASEFERLHGLVVGSTLAPGTVNPGRASSMTIAGRHAGRAARTEARRKRMDNEVSLATVSSPHLWDLSSWTRTGS